MKYLFLVIFIGLSVFVFGFSKKNHDKIANDNEVLTAEITGETSMKGDVPDATPRQASGFVEYAKSLIGTRYLYGSMDPSKGLDCSGFINVVSNHFGIDVPRSSVEFTNIGSAIDVDNAKPGDLILFTGTDTSRRVVGHIGIVTENNDEGLQFIHSSSGKANGVTMSALEGYYETRFVKVIRILPADTINSIA